MPRTSFAVTATLVLSFALFADRPAAAQEVRWRHDYNAALREAKESGRPLLLDFGTESCGWCRKMDATTFRDPAIVKAVNERFVPVKIDGNQNERLTASLHVEAFPTLVIASSDGAVVGRHTGYASSAQLGGLLAKAPAAAPPPPSPVVQAVAPRKPDEPSDWRRVKARIDADLAALYPEIAAALGR